VAVHRIVENHQRNRFILGSCLLLFSAFINIFLALSIFATDEYEVGEASDSTIIAPESLNFSADRSVSVSPDGQHLAFTLVDNSNERFLYVQKTDGSEGRRLPDTSGAHGAFWSPHNDALGFFASGTLKTIRLNDLNAITLCNAPEGKDGTWNKSGVILFSLQSDGPLYRVADTGGKPVPATEIVSEDQTPSRPQPRYEVAHQWPHFLPDDDHFIYVSKSLNSENIAYLESLRSNERIRLFPNTESRVEFASPGYLLYVYQSTLVARPFDLKQLVPSNIYEDILPLKTHIGHNLDGDAIFSVSQTGLLAHWEGQDGLIWLDRNNQAEIFSRLPGEHDQPRFSPDGKWLAVSLRLQSQDQSDIWVYSLEQGTRSRLTTQGFNSHPVWSPNSQQVAFWSLRQNEAGVFVKDSKNTAAEIPVFVREIDSTQQALPRFWSSAGLAYTFRNPEDEHANIFLVTPEQSTQPLTPDQPTAFTAASGTEVPRVSPDGQWLAYSSQSQETARSEIWVQSTMDESRQWMVSDSGGTVPVWSPDGRKLFYRRSNSFDLMLQSKNPLAKLMVVPVSTEQEFESETPRVLLRRHGTNYDIAPDGNRFIQVHRQATALTLTVNWKKDTSPTDDGDSVVPDLSTIDVIR
jgi:Tol biopolymer transport system component